MVIADIFKIVYGARITLETSFILEVRPSIE